MKYVIDIDLDNPVHNYGGTKTYVDETNGTMWELSPAMRDKLRSFDNEIAAAEQRWIPTSERLPKVREWVLCQCRAGIMDVLRLTEDGEWNKIYPPADYMSGFVIAWMPLPKGYSGEKYDKKMPLPEQYREEE